jgi:hypothetical protein
MYDKSMELKTQLHRDRLLEQAEAYRLIKMTRASRSGDRKPVLANIREAFTSLGLWLKAAQVRLQVS